MTDEIEKELQHIHLLLDNKIISQEEFNSRRDKILEENNLGMYINTFDYNSEFERPFKDLLSEYLKGNIDFGKLMNKLNDLIDKIMDVTFMNYDQMVEELGKGKRAARLDWQAPEFIFMKPEEELSVDFIVNKVKSLPQSLKDYFVPQFAWTAEEELTDKSPTKKMIKFTSYICLKTADDVIINGWNPSIEDIEAEDWFLV
jgi:hypothetical protein